MLAEGKTGKGWGGGGGGGGGGFQQGVPVLGEVMKRYNASYKGCKGQKACPPVGHLAHRGVWPRPLALPLPCNSPPAWSAGVTTVSKQYYGKQPNHHHEASKASCSEAS